MAPVALSPGGATQFNGSQSLVTTTAHYQPKLRPPNLCNARRAAVRTSLLSPCLVSTATTGAMPPASAMATWLAAWDANLFSALHAAPTPHYHTSLPHHTPTPRLPVCIGAGSLIVVPLQVETCGKPCDNPAVRHNTSSATSCTTCDGLLVASPGTPVA